MSFFMNIIDVTAVNAYIVWMALDPEWKKCYLRKRPLFLLDLESSKATTNAEAVQQSFRKRSTEQIYN